MGHAGRVLQSPRRSLRGRRLPRRLIQLYAGLALYGVSMALMLRSTLGNMPWDVLHQGIAGRLGWSIGTVAIVVGALVLLAWIPLRQMPGLGTVANVLVIGIATDVSLWLMPVPESMLVRVLLILGGIVLNGLAGALYIGAQLGTGPRDGLMTGIARRTRFSLRLVRTAIEVTVLAIGFALGGLVGVGTVLYALAIGPLVQKMLPWVVVRLTPPTVTVPVVTEPDIAPPNAT